MINYYYYQGQLRKYLLQFCSIFVGLKVQTGNGECNEPEFITVPIRIGNKDRVVAALEAGNTQNRPFSLPFCSASMTNLSLPTSRKGVGTVDRRSYLPEGGIWPKDIRTATRIMPIAFNMDLELAIYASNTLQMHQMLEQILMLFDPILQIQTSDAAFDWTAITVVELTDIQNEENFPVGGDRRVISWTLKFSMPIYISAPMNIVDEIVRKISIHVGDLSGLTINEFDDQGNLVPFRDGSLFSSDTIDATDSEIISTGHIQQP